jgi:hypothetical protein
MLEIKSSVPAFIVIHPHINIQELTPANIGWAKVVLGLKRL